MMTSVVRRFLIAPLAAAVFISFTLSSARAADDLSQERVNRVIESAKKFLINRQSQRDGSWSAGAEAYKVGVSSLALLALLNAGMTPDDAPVKRGLEFLRSVKDPEPKLTYEISLMISALAAAKDGNRDKARILILATRLEKSQITQGENSGSWTYSGEGEFLNFGGDRSNGQFAVLGLRDAADAGAPVSREVWQRARDHWVKSQGPDGGWDYSGARSASSTGSMTVAGISTLVITQSMLSDEKDFEADGETPNCCTPPDPDKSLERGLRWMGQHFQVGTNPGANRTWHLYYLYGLERAGRLGGVRFFGEHDWYREGARYLIEAQTNGFWEGEAGMEKDAVVGTSFCLLFLSKGLAPVLINKLQYGPPDPNNRLGVVGDDWNRHKGDVRNLTELISGLPRWPRLVTWQTVNMNTLEQHGGVSDLQQASVAYLSGREAPQLTDRQVALLREYVTQGGFLFASANCQGAGFDQGIRDLVRRMFPEGDAELKRLKPDHPVFRAEHPLDGETVHLEGVDLGCRTPIIYSPDDLSCFWEKWARQDPPKRDPRMKGMILRATRIGTNVLAYATGREPPKKLEQQEQFAQAGRQEKIERGFLQIAKIRHEGTWDAAPQALRNLLTALNQTVGMAASTQTKAIPLTDPNVFKFPIVFMHGRTSFQLSKAERDQLKLYLARGGVLFADAACGAQPFDQSFRGLMDEMYSGGQFKRIPMSSELFTTKIGHDIRKVKRRAPEVDNPNAALNAVVQEGEPYLEGIEVDGRWVVLYSKYDLSCTLERQSSVACAGYLPDDALKIAVNIVLYALLQDVRYATPAVE